MDIKITGMLPISTDTATEESLHDFIEKNFSELMNLSDGAIYVSGHVEEDELEVIEEFLIKIFPVLDLREPLVLKIKGELANHLGNYYFEEDGITRQYLQDNDGVPETIIKQILKIE